MMTRDSLDKIRLKGGPKQYKRGPGLTGRARLQQRVARLLLDAARLGRHEGLSFNDYIYACALRDLLQQFLTKGFHEHHDSH